MSEKIVTVEAKPAAKSKLNIVGAVQIAIGLLDTLGATDVLGSDVAGYFALASGFLTIILRTFGTQRPVAMSKKDVDIKVAA